MRVGVLGGGQLGRMLGLAGARLGVEIRYFDPAPDACAAVVGEHVCASYGDTDALQRFASGLDVATFEFENVPVAAVRRVLETVQVRPSIAALTASQDRVEERAALTTAGATTPASAPVGSFDDLENAVREVSLPGFLKARRGGYDGKGQRRIEKASDLAGAWRQINAPAIYDAHIAFDRELSQVSVRAADGSVAHYPLVENVHEKGILRRTTAPAQGVTENQAAHARHVLERLLQRLDIVGVAAAEFFEIDGALIANEFAPRVHNSGHWTMDGAATCQFENHLRAILGWPLGSTEVVRPTVMENLIGEAPNLPALLADPTAKVHLYAKAARPGRKIGHINRPRA